MILITATISPYAYALTILNTWGSNGSGNGQFHGPSGIDLDFKGNVMQFSCNSHHVFKIIEWSTLPYFFINFSMVCFSFDNLMSSRYCIYRTESDVY